ncbi:MAG: flagellar hook-length control protein FliK [Planctomycetes bacterium]|nr:flagellar hook-length control protein FliK [Planctomycetota bacterium]
MTRPQTLSDFDRAAPTPKPRPAQGVRPPSAAAIATPDQAFDAHLARASGEATDQNQKDLTQGVSCQDKGISDESRPSDGAQSAQQAQTRTQAPVTATQKAVDLLRRDGPTDLDDLATQELQSSTPHGGMNVAETAVPLTGVAPKEAPTAPPSRIQSSGGDEARSLDREGQRPEHSQQPGATNTPGGAKQSQNAQNTPPQTDQAHTQGAAESSVNRGTPHTGSPTQAGQSLATAQAVKPSAAGANVSEPRVTGVGGVKQTGDSVRALSRLKAAAEPRARLVAQDSMTRQVTGGLAAALKQGGGTASLTLRPEALGELTLNVAVEGDAVSVELRPQTELAHQLLTDSLGPLRESLEARGLRVERIEIAAVESPRDEQRLEGHQPREPGEQSTGSQDPKEWASGEQGRGGDSHPGTRHAAESGRTDASDAEVGAAEPRESVPGSSALLRMLGADGALRIDATA